MKQLPSAGLSALIPELKLNKVWSGGRDLQQPQTCGPHHQGMAASSLLGIYSLKPVNR